MSAPTLGDILAQALAYTGPTDEDVQFTCAAHLVRALAPNLRIDEREIFDALTCVPDSMLDMLKSPQGWTELAAHVSADLGCDPINYSPTVH